MFRVHRRRRGKCYHYNIIVTIAPFRKGSCLATLSNSRKFLDQIEVVRALSYIERLSSDRHLGFSEQGVLPLHLAAEIHALDRLMRTSW